MNMALYTKSAGPLSSVTIRDYHRLHLRLLTKSQSYLELRNFIARAEVVIIASSRGLPRPASTTSTETEGF